MTTPIIYADFMGLMPSGHTKQISAIPLDTYGSLRDLSNQQIRLHEGLALIVYMDSAEGEDIEADSIVYYDAEHQWWMAEIDEKKIRYVPTHSELWDRNEFLCINCRKDLVPYFGEFGRTLETCCPNCGTSILTPILVP